MERKDVKENLRRYIAEQKRRVDAAEFEVDRRLQRHLALGAIDFALYAKLIDYEDGKELSDVYWSEYE